MNTNFVNELERELRAASRRRIRLALARVPRAPAGAAAIVFAVAVCAAVAVPLLQIHSRRSAADSPPSISTSRSLLRGDGIGTATFGDRPATVTTRLSTLLGVRPNKGYHAATACQVDHVIQWPGLIVYFHHARFVGYRYAARTGSNRIPPLATAKGLRVGDTLKQGRRLYGSRFHITAEQGGAWLVATPHGRIAGYTSSVTNLQGRVLSIEAGRVGCPAMTP